MVPGFALVLLALTFFTIWLVATLTAIVIADEVKARRQRRALESKTGGAP